MAGEPLWRLLGAGDRFVPGYASGLDYGLTDDELVRLHERFAERGFTSAKLKGGRDLADDLRRLGLRPRHAAARTPSAPGLMLDANESWHRSPGRAAHCAGSRSHSTSPGSRSRYAAGTCGGHAAIRQHVRAGIASGENLTGLEQLRPLIDADAIDIVQVGSVWGITHFLRVAHLAHAHDLPVSPVGYTAVVAPAAGALPNFLVAEVQDLQHPRAFSSTSRSRTAASFSATDPGLGLTLDEDALSGVVGDSGWSATSGPHVRPVRAGRRMVPEDDGGAATGDR